MAIYVHVTRGRNTVGVQARAYIILWLLLYAYQVGYGHGLCSEAYFMYIKCMPQNYQTIRSILCNIVCT